MSTVFRHLLLFSALLAFTAPGGGNALAGGGGGGDHQQGPGGGGDHQQGPGDGGDHQQGPGDGGDHGDGHSSPGEHQPWQSSTTPSLGAGGSSEQDIGFFWNPGFFNRRVVLPPADGDNGAGDDLPPPATPETSLATMTLPDPAQATPPAPGGTPGIRLHGSHAALFVKTPVLDQEQSKQAIQGGQAASMPLLLTYLDQKYPGQVLDVKLHNTNDGLVYEVRYLANVVELRTLFLDAMTLNRK